tara:strand:+ start:1906 stop:2049 length:144 start_codon:yes stop_codon:yes gene_type:complete
MKVTPKEKKVIEQYLNYYYKKVGDNDIKNQIKLLYDHLTFIVKESNK